MSHLSGFSPELSRMVALTCRQFPENDQPGAAAGRQGYVFALGRDLVRSSETSGSDAAWQHIAIRLVLFAVQPPVNTIKFIDDVANLTVSPRNKFA